MNRLHVTPQLQVLDTDSKPIEGVFAIGDNATPADGNKLPATAQGMSLFSAIGTHLLASLCAIVWKLITPGSRIADGNVSVQGFQQDYK